MAAGGEREIKLGSRRGLNYDLTAVGTCGSSRLGQGKHTKYSRDTNLGRGCGRPHHLLVAASDPLLLVVGVLVAEPPAGRGRPRDGRLGLGGAAVIPCIAGVFVGPRGRRRRGGQKVA